MNSVRYASGPSADGNKGFHRRPVPKPAMKWAAMQDRKECYGYPGTPIAAPATYTAARVATIAFLQSLKGDDIAFHAHTNRHGWGNDVTADNLDTAFPVTEEMVEEYHGVSVTKGGEYLHTVYLFPLSSYLWANTRRFWEPKDEEEDHDDHDDHPYDEEDYGHYDAEDEQWSCNCGASGPFFCSCNDNDD